MTTSDHILGLVRKALDQFDEDPLDVSVRRAIRIANLAGDTKHAIRLSMEIRPITGDPETNSETSRMLMADPSVWSSLEGPHEDALRQHMADRRIGKGENANKFDSHSLSELEFWKEEYAELKRSGEPIEYGHDLETRIRANRIIERTRHLTFAMLCSWERRFEYASINESIFDGYRVKVDKLLAESAPDLVQQFNAVYRRLKDASRTSPDALAAEELSQSATTCRRILKAVVDHVMPPQEESSSDGMKMGDAQHRNRFKVYLRQVISSKSGRQATGAMTEGLYDRFVAIDTMTNKGVHAAIAFETANFCALNTYVICGEILTLHSQNPK
jgi:hypothetical protein